ncbi:hypothetical protein [Hominifimenecus sp. rT4P-3]|uniref:hypothetical protein n=1 Tax=Hominifimenecus sp. rT4P-3 TaxID=3242979 RepID=UPI003DA4CE5E
MDGKERMRLAWKTLPGWGTVFSVLGVALSAICLTIGGRIYMEVQTEKSRPCEIKGSMAMDGDTIGKIRQMEAVLAISGVEDASGTILYGDYQASVHVIGVDAGYLKGEWLLGGAYPDETAMPYVALNEAAVKGFQDAKKAGIPEEKQPDWLSESFYLDGISSELRICGILKDGEEEARAYVSQGQWAGLSLGAGEGGARSFWVRLQKEGVKEQAVRDLAALGFQVTDQGESQAADWEIREERQFLYLGAGTFGLAWSLLLFGYQRRLCLALLAYEEKMFLWMGYRLNRKVAFWQWAMVILAGGALGVCAGWLLGI